MKFIIIGLGNFGTALAEKLTLLGHEVIGVDKEMNRVESIRKQISYAVCLDCKQPETAKSLPLGDTDVVIVSIGEDEGANVMITALMKKLKVKRLISRAVSPLHETILEAMDVDEIVRPEEESADKWVKKLTAEGYLDSLELSSGYHIVEAYVPAKFAGKTIAEAGFNTNYNIIVLTVMKERRDKNILGITRKITKIEAQGIARPDTLLQKGDILVMYGHQDDIHKLLKM